MSRINIEQWHELCNVFEQFFSNIHGEVEHIDDALRFISPSDSVQTSLFLYRRGSFAASMPLHGIDAKVEHLHFDKEENQIQLLGAGVDYTYKVPPQLMMLQGE